MIVSVSASQAEGAGLRCAVLLLVFFMLLLILFMLLLLLVLLMLLMLLSLLVNCCCSALPARGAPRREGGVMQGPLQHIYTN